MEDESTITLTTQHNANEALKMIPNKQTMTPEEIRIFHEQYESLREKVGHEKIMNTINNTNKYTATNNLLNYYDDTVQESNKEAYFIKNKEWSENPHDLLDSIIQRRDKIPGEPLIESYEGDPSMPLIILCPQIHIDINGNYEQSAIKSQENIYKTITWLRENGISNVVFNEGTNNNDYIQYRFSLNDEKFANKSIAAILKIDNEKSSKDIMSFNIETKTKENQKTSDNLVFSNSKDIIIEKLHDDKNKTISKETFSNMLLDSQKTYNKTIYRNFAFDLIKKIPEGTITTEEAIKIFTTEFNKLLNDDTTLSQLDTSSEERNVMIVENMGKFFQNTPSNSAIIIMGAAHFNDYGDKNIQELLRGKGYSYVMFDNPYLNTPPTQQ